MYQYNTFWKLKHGIEWNVMLSSKPSLCKFRVREKLSHHLFNISSKSSDSSTELVPRSTGWFFKIESRTKRTILSSFLALNWNLALYSWGQDWLQVSLDGSMNICKQMRPGQASIPKVSQGLDQKPLLELCQFKPEKRPGEELNILNLVDLPQCNTTQQFTMMYPCDVKFSGLS